MKRQYFFLILFIYSPFFLFAQDSLNVMFYNLLFFPDSGSATRYEEFKTVFEHAQPDVLLVCELQTEEGADILLNNALNVNGITKYRRANFVSNSTGGTLNNLLFYNSEKLALVSQVEVPTARRDIGAYTMYYKDSNLWQNQDTVFFQFMSTHFKAGSTSANKETRRQTALDFINYINTSPNVSNRIFGGDFNMQSSFEPAYDLVLNGPEQVFFDPLDSPGSWKDNSLFEAIHTQSPRNSSFGNGVSGGLDDRYDFLLYSEDIFQVTDRVSYVPDSYITFGNDGNHINQSILSGTNNSVPPNVLTALHNASDHLPVMLTLAIQPSNVNTAIKPVENPKSIQLFPNPVNSDLQIRSQKYLTLGSQVSIFDLLGNKIGTFTIDQLNYYHQFPMHSIPTGSYILKIEDAQQLFIQRFVKM